MITVAGQEGAFSEEYDSRISSLYKRMKTAAKRDVPPLVPKTQKPAQPLGVIDISDPQKKLSAPEVEAIHAQLVRGGLYNAASADGGGAPEDKEELRDLLLRNSFIEPVYVMEPMTPEQMRTGMRDMLLNQQKYAKFVRADERWAKWRGYASYAFGGIVGTLAFAWGYMHLLGKPEESMTHLDKFISKSSAAVFDVVLLTAQTAHSFMDPSLSWKEKLRVAAASGLKLSSHAMNYGLEIGVRYLFGGLLLGPIGGVVGVVLVTAVVAANNVLIDMACECILGDINTLSRTAAEQAVTDEFLMKEYKGVLSQIEAEKKKSLGGTMMRALYGSSKSPALAVLACIAGSVNPYQTKWVDRAVDAVAINWILVPRIMGLAGRVFGSDSFRAAVLNPLSDSFRAMKKWPHFGSVLDWMERHYILLFMEKIILQVVKANATQLLRTYFRTANLRSGMDAAYDKIWGAPQVQVPSQQEVVDSALAVPNHEDELKQATEALAIKTANVQAGGSLALEQARVDDLTKAVEFERAQAVGVAQVAGDDPSKSCGNLMKMLEFRINRYRKSLQLKAWLDLTTLDRAAYEKLGESAAGTAAQAQMANVMGQASLGRPTFDQVLEWRNTRNIWEKLRLHRELTNPKEIVDQLTTDGKAINDLTHALNVTANAEAEMIIAGLRTPKQLRDMPAPWKKEVLERFNHQSDLRRDRDETLLQLSHARMRLRMSSPQYTYADLLRNPKDMDELKLTFPRESDQPLVNFSPTEKDLDTWKAAVYPEERKKIEDWLKIEDFSKDKGLQESTLQNGMEPVNSKTYRIPSTSSSGFASKVQEPMLLPVSGSFGPESPAPAFRPNMGAISTQEIQQGITLSTATLVRNIVTTSTRVAFAISQTTTNILALFYGGLSALARTTAGFFDKVFPPSESADPQQFDPTTRLSDIAKSGLSNCIFTSAKYYLGEDPVTGQLVPFVNGELVSKACYTVALGRLVKGLTNQAIQVGVETAATTALGAFGVGWIGKGLATGSLSAVKTARLWRVAKALSECNNMHTVELTRVATKDYKQAVLCHLHNLRMHDLCLTGGVNFISATNGDDPCKKVAVWIDNRDLPGALLAAKDLFGSVAGAVQRRAAATGYVGQTTALLRTGAEAISAGSAMYLNRDPVKQKAIDLLVYGSEGISTARFSKTQLNTVDQALLQELEKKLPWF